MTWFDRISLRVQATLVSQRPCVVVECSGPAIARACQRTCGACSLSLRRVPQHDEPQEKTEEEQEIQWKAMDFANLPGSLDRRPFFNSPYHYRFDWCALPSPHALLCWLEESCRSLSSSLSSRNFPLSWCLDSHHRLQAIAAISASPVAILLLRQGGLDSHDGVDGGSSRPAGRAALHPSAD